MRAPQDLSRFLILAVLFAAIGITSARAAPEAWREEIDQLTARDADAPPPRGAVLFVGSSSVRLWRTLAEDFPGTVTINRGFGGSELADSIFYFDRIVTPYRPRMVVLYAGDNDINGGKTAEQVLADFKSFRKKLADALPEARLVYLSIKQSPARAALREEMRRANVLIGAECARDAHCRFADVASALLGKDGGFRSELFEADGLHINRAGYAAWARVLAVELQD